MLTPGRYVGAADAEDDGEPFDEKMKRLTAELREQFAESARLEEEIRANLASLGFGGEIVTKTGGRPATTGVIPGRFALSVGKPDREPPLGWRWTLLTDVARLETGHTPSRNHPEYWGGDVPWIGIRDATAAHGRTIFETHENTNELGIKNSSARILPAETVCLSRTASVGYVVVMGRPMATSQDFVNWVCSDKIDYRFLKYVLLADHDSLLMFASGSVHQTIYFPEVKAFHVCLPPIEEQRRIADILSALDDKTELNDRMNRTLESIARAIFKSWFVDFDPVRRKMEGKTGGELGLPLPLVALFPGRLQESPLGSIPHGWNVGTIKSEFRLTMGQSPPGDTYNDIGEGLPFYQGRRDFGSRFPARRIDCSAPARRAEAGDTLVSVRAPVGDINIATEPCCIGRGVAAVRHRSGASIYTYEMMHSLRDVFADFETTGTVFGAIGGKDFRVLPVVTSPAELIAAYERTVSSIGDSSRAVMPTLGRWLSFAIGSCLGFYPRLERGPGIS